MLVTLSVIVWLLAAAVGWRLCKRALLPVTRMAKAAGSMSMADGNERLPIPGTGDELDLLAGSFNGLLDRLHQEFERQKRFTGDASHQLRTPLAALLGQLEVARRRDRSVEEYQRVLDEVHGEALRLRQIVESLLFMARAESEAGMPELEPVELVLWVRERLTCRLSGGERAQDLNERLTTEAPVCVQVQPQLLGQVAREPAGQRLQVQSRGDTDHGGAGARGRVCHACRAGPRSRDRSRGSGARVRAILSLGEIAVQTGRGAGPGGGRADCDGVRWDRRRP